MPAVVVAQGRIGEARTVAANETIDNMPKTAVFVQLELASY